MDIQFLNRGFFQRIFGIPATTLARNPASWNYSNGRVTIDLSRLPELRTPGSAVRLEGGALPERVLVVHAPDGNFHAFRNRCTHVGHRRLDPVPGTDTVQCCSVGKSTYDLNGERLYGPAGHAITTYPVSRDNDTLMISLS